MNLGVTAVMLPELDFEEQIALCVALGLRYYQYRPRIIPADHRDQPYSCWGNHKFDLTPERFLKEGKTLTKKLRQAGMEPWGTSPSANINDPDDTLRLHLEGAAHAEARCVRVNPPPYPDKPFNYAELLEHVIRRYDVIVQTMARPMGIKLIIETHCGSLATSPGLAWAIYIDPAASLFIAGFILHSIWGMLSNSFYDLLDRTLDESLQLIIVKELATHFDHYKDIYGVRSRRSGSHVYVDLMLEFDGDKKMAEVQAIINRMETDLERSIPGCHVLIAPTTRARRTEDRQQRTEDSLPAIVLGGRREDR